MDEMSVFQQSLIEVEARVNGKITNLIEKMRDDYNDFKHNLNKDLDQSVGQFKKEVSD